MEKPITFQSNNETLAGMIHLPDHSATNQAEFGVIFAHFGSRGRIGNTFQYPRYARTFCKLGFPVLRFDPHGYGESSGHIESCLAKDFYGTIQTGRYVPDTLAAIEEFYRHVSVKKLILFGICGGAITALLTVLQTKKISGLVLLSIPVIIDNANQKPEQRMPKEYALESLRATYLYKILSPRAWLRFLLKRSETDTIKTLIKAAVFNKSNKRNLNKNRESEDAPPFNQLFLDALNAAVKQKVRTLFLFGDDDSFRWEFERDFYNKYWSTNPAYQEKCEIHYLPGCNHMFTMREWQGKAMEITQTWLKRF